MGIERKRRRRFSGKFWMGNFWCVGLGLRVRVFPVSEGRMILRGDIHQSFPSTDQFITTTRIPHLLVPFRSFFCSSVVRTYGLNFKKKAFTVNSPQKGSGIATYQLSRNQLQELRQLPTVESSLRQRSKMGDRANIEPENQQRLRSQEEIEGQVQIRNRPCF
jgi:hypothetical protein